MTVRLRWRSILERSTQMVQLRLHNWARYTGSPRSGWVPLPQASYNILASPLAISFFLSRAGHWQEWLVKRPEFPCGWPLISRYEYRTKFSGLRSVAFPAALPPPPRARRAWRGCSCLLYGWHPRPQVPREWGHSPWLGIPSDRQCCTDAPSC